MLNTSCPCSFAANPQSIHKCYFITLMLLSNLEMKIKVLTFLLLRCDSHHRSWDLSQLAQPTPVEFFPQEHESKVYPRRIFINTKIRCIQNKTRNQNTKYANQNTKYKSMIFCCDFTHFSKDLTGPKSWRCTKNYKPSFVISSPKPKTATT